MITVASESPAVEYTSTDIEVSASTSPFGSIFIDLNSGGREFILTDIGLELPIISSSALSICAIKVFSHSTRFSTSFSNTHSELLVVLSSCSSFTTICIWWFLRVCPEIVILFEPSVTLFSGESIEISTFVSVSCLVISISVTHRTFSSLRSYTYIS
jgi:hypothetical protein